MNKSFSSAKAALVCSFRAGENNRRHPGCGNVMRSRGCAVQNKGITLIDDGILLSKLEAYGAASKELLLFENYLNDRRQSVVMDGVQSEHRLITHGVPQGSVLGPLPLAVSRSIVDTCADDTTLSAFAAVSDLPAIQQRLQEDINLKMGWC